MDGSPIWLTTEGNARPPLRGRHQADAVVVGGGLCGITTAYLLAKGGLRVTLLEADKLGHGASGHATGKVTVQHGLVYSRLKSQWGLEVAQAYAVTQSAALKAMSGLVKELQIPCGWTWQSASLAALDAAEEHLLKREEAAAQAAGLPVAMTSAGECPVPVRCLLTIPAQAMFNPAAYLCALAEGFEKMGGRIFEYSRVQMVDTQSVATQTGSVHASFIIIATHFPIINFPGWYFLRARQQRSYAAALVGAPAFQGMYLHIAPGGFSLRRHENMTLLGCFDYPCGKETDVDHELLLRGKAEALFPDSKLACSWHSQDLISADGLPFIGPYSRRTPNHFVAAGFSKWGMTGSMVAAQAISARILGDPMEELMIYDPERTIKHSLSPVLSAASGTALAMLSGLLHKKAPKCPHMGCRLTYVPSTSSWDCPCHGSRFDSIGRIKNSPSVRSVVIRNKSRPS